MKKLTRVKLINWHSFHNETVEFGGSVLLSGENGAGKSTLLDAIQFVITASKNHFNKAAHDHGKRKLSGYVRYKTGKENKPYERFGQVTAHVALEFYDEGKKNFFIIGAVVDSISEDNEKTIWYRMENIQLKDELFLQGSFPKSIDVFRSTNKLYLKMQAKTQIDARKDFKARFGRLEDKFFDLIPKALAFKPIDDIKDFVYTYVLDEKEVNIEALRENVRTYQDFEILLQGIKIKMGKLEAISEQYRQIRLCIRNNTYYEYYIARANLELCQKEIRETKEQQASYERELTRLQQAEKEILHEKERKDQRLRDITLELDKDEDYIAIRKAEERIAELQKKIEELQLDKNRLMDSVKKAVTGAHGLLKALENRGLPEVPVAKEFVSVFSSLEKCEETSAAYGLTEKYIDYKKAEAPRIERSIFENQQRKSNLTAEMKELNRRIENLTDKKLDYGVNVTKLQAAIKEELLRLGRNHPVHVLCELLAVTDERWKNAVEGYLNTQKFYLLVEPEDFNIALSVYEKMKKTHGLFGAGVINVAKLEEYDAEHEGSLASKVASRNPYAKRFINMLLNNVILCEKVEELKLHRKAITPSCVRYQNRVAVVINPKLYEVPFIGADAYAIQLALTKKLYQEKQREVQAIDEELAGLTTLRGFFDYEAETDIRYRLNSLVELRAGKARLAEEEKGKKSLEENSTVLFKQMERQKLLKELDQLMDRWKNNRTEQGGYGTKVQDAILHVVELETKSVGLGERLDEIVGRLGDTKAICQQEYEKILKGKELEKLKEDYENTKKGNQTKLENLSQEMIIAMNRYKSEHDFGGEASLRGYPVFREVYDKLKDSELLEYEGKVQKARQAAEEEFREQFLSKLQENIKKAHGEFNELNKALSSIPFSNDYYRFEYGPSRKYRQYYNMIMDDFNVIDGESLFSGAFNQRHKEVIDELFSKLTAEGENSSKILDEFTDYRTYMDYDIRITHGMNGDYSYYSKVCEEKSGGETQTPFYVTVAASFMQLYSNGIGGDAIGLILLDEAFNSMDDERITGVLEFFGRLPLQIVVAAPPDKIQYIQPALRHTLLVLKDGDGSYVEDFSYEKL